MASWNDDGDKESDSMSSATLDFRTKLMIVILVAPTASPVPTLRPMPVPACVVIHCHAYLPLIYR